jgi:hypothetical protein
MRLQTQVANRRWGAGISLDADAEVRYNAATCAMMIGAMISLFSRPTAPANIIRSTNVCKEVQRMGNNLKQLG